MYDTFVALPDATLDGFTIFGKNSWRPRSEIQLITHSPHQTHKNGEKLKFSQIKIPQVSETYGILMSQPFWMWGAEMGVSEYDVAIGNEPVYTREPVEKRGLLGNDLVRLGLERSKDAQEALEVITNLLEQYGQGGDYRKDNVYWSYHNSFILADPKEAYVLETAGKWWIVEKIQGVRSISNQLTIHGKGDQRREGIIAHAINEGYCKNEEQFDFARSFMRDSTHKKYPLKFKENISKEILEKNKGDITLERILEFFREVEDMETEYEDYLSAAIQISHLKRAKKSTHWFTGGPLSKYNLIKPYIFPIKDQKVNNPGPYKNAKSDWFWKLNKDYIKPQKGDINDFDENAYINERRAFEKKIIDKVRILEHQKDELKPVEYRNRMAEINKEVWKKAYELISLKPQIK
jgi:secernin